MRTKIFLGALVFIAAFAHAGRVQAMPIFAQRYLLQCKTCHSVLPELNAFGRSFRAHGYRLPLPKHGTTGIALRYQLEYEVNPSSGSRRYSPGGVLLSDVDIGQLNAYVHYNLGAGGGPSALYLGSLSTYNAHTQSQYRLGLYELPLLQSPGERLDDLQQYGYYGIHVGLNDLPLSSPRWGAQLQRTFGNIQVNATVSLGAFKGAAYGGKPIETGVTTWANAPELGLFTQATIIPGVIVGGQYLSGVQWIVPQGREGFADPYHREGLLARATYKKWDLQAEQWWGGDMNADGFGTLVGSSGGYIRLKYYPTPHSYFGIRYDASANPFITRDVVYYFAFMATPHVRLLFQQVQNINGPGNFGAAFTIGLPWPRKL